MHENANGPFEAGAVIDEDRAFVFVLGSPGWPFHVAYFQSEVLDSSDSGNRVHVF